MPIGGHDVRDEKRQWFKAKVGFTEAETPQEIAFCTCAIHQTDFIVATGASKDERGSAGDQERQGLGTLCVIDRVPGVLTSEPEQALRVLGREGGE